MKTTQSRVVKTWLSAVITASMLLVAAAGVTAATKDDHNKEIVGYITQWDPWKDTKAGFVTKGAANHLNVDMDKYTILNFSFFGVAVDGSLHSGDFRNKDIYKEGTVQQPANLLNGDIYSSWDYYILYGELAPTYVLNDDAKAQGFVAEGNGWRNTITGLTGSMPIPVKKPGGQPGLIELAHSKGVKVMASIGGWSMCRHFPEMAADPQKRAKFMEGVRTLMKMGFDGIDLDWEYPGPYSGMNFTGSEADYPNFLTLVKEIRAEIGPDKLITSAFSADTRKLEGFDWVELNKYMDLYNMMTYDFNGGWSNIAGHNSPLYPYTGAEVSEFNWDHTAQWLLNKGIPSEKINMGVAFYGRGVVTQSSAALNGPTKKVDIIVQPDGPISSAGDFVNWPKDVYDATPNYFFIKQKEADGWTLHWDDEAKVPYMTKQNYFVSFDDEKSIGLKAQYVNDYNFGGVIVWQVAGDQQCLGGYTMHGKLPKCNRLNPTLANKLNDVFAQGCQGCPTVRITSPAAGSVFAPGSNITIEVSAADTDGSVTRVEYSANGNPIGSSTQAPFTFTWKNVTEGDYNITATAYDNANNMRESAKVSVSVNEDHLKPVVNITKPDDQIVQDQLTPVSLAATAVYDGGQITDVEFTVGNTTLAGTSAGNNSYTATWTPTRYGAHTLSVKATNNNGYSKTESKTFTIIQCTGEPWDPSKVYTGGMEVLYKDKIYRARWWTQNNQPDVSDVWEYIKDCDPTIPDPSPVVTVTSPKDGAVFNLGDVIDFTVTATDEDGSVTKVDFYNNNQLIDTVTGAPYSVSIRDAAIGKYTLRAVATDDSAQQGEASVSIEVVDSNTNLPPKADFASSVTDLTASFTDHSSDSDGTINSWYWTFGDGTTSVESNPSHTYASADTYTVTLTVTDDDGDSSDPASKSVTVGSTNPNEVPDANFKFNAQGLVVEFSDLSSDRDGDVTEWAWDFGDGNTSTSMNPTHTYTREGTYQVTLTVSDDKGASSKPITQSVIVAVEPNDLPVAAFATSVDKLTATFTDRSTDHDGTVTAWSWDFGDGSSATTANPSHTYAKAGTYTVTLTVTDNKGANSQPASESVKVGDSTGSCDGIPQYPDGIGSYVGGTQIQNGGVLYQCKPFPYEGWCNQGSAYEPGAGWAWQDAWVEVKSCR
ncbi:glycosyl hydrolase family 18 protein [Aliikangiella sp. IMCC44359]|uniref:glycosyl hydrolase family 18 protein n=1 Tax=Aliikangiella sp. IMCC44359 TaxID=3459125 RepID=UPI00403AF643